MPWSSSPKPLKLAARLPVTRLVLALLKRLLDAVASVVAAHDFSTHDWRAIPPDSDLQTSVDPAVERMACMLCTAIPRLQREVHQISQSERCAYIARRSAQLLLAQCELGFDGVAMETLCSSYSDRV